jgi:hypothetical protein
MRLTTKAIKANCISPRSSSSRPLYFFERTDSSKPLCRKMTHDKRCVCFARCAVGRAGYNFHDVMPGLPARALALQSPQRLNLLDPAREDGSQKGQKHKRRNKDRSSFPVERPTAVIHSEQGKVTSDLDMSILWIQHADSESIA